MEVMMVAEVRYGVQTLDHIALGVRDLERNRKFYIDVLGLKPKPSRCDAAGSAPEAHVLAGQNSIRLHPRGVRSCPSATGAPRVGIAVKPARLMAISEQLKTAKYPFRGPMERGEDTPFIEAIYFDDPDGNHLEICVRRDGPEEECISHTVFETRDLEKTITFYTEALGTGVPIACENELFIPVQNRQMIGFAHVAALSERTRKASRSGHMALKVMHEDFDSMVTLVERYGGKIQPDKREEEEPRPAGERSIYFFDLDNNRLRITAPDAQGAPELFPHERDWPRMFTERKQQAREVGR
jgi:catechol 2,3-dioxygenase-like lactoylglutathione lyase family enzyme